MRFPVFSCPVTIRGGRAVCHLPHRIVTLDAPAGLLAALASLCDGDTALASIHARLAEKWHRAALRRLLAALENSGVLVEADRTALAAWPLVENPVRRPEPLPGKELARLVEARAADRVRAGAMRGAPLGLGKLLAARRSTRHFARRLVSAAKIRSILWAAYGVARGHRTVPSGGALYPLDIRLLVLRAGAGLGRGVYAASFRADGAVGLRRVAADVRAVYRAYVDPGSIATAQCIVVVSGRFGLSARKYGNRAVLLVTLEAGHAAQNAMLAATQLGVGAVEIAGFFERRLRGVARASGDTTPLTSIVLGAPARERAPTEAPEFEWIELERAASFELGAAKFPGWDDGGDLCWGRDADPLLAYDKAVAEAWERMACERPRGIRMASGVDLKNALDPGSLAAYLPGQYRRAGFPFKPYSAHREYGWSDAKDYRTGRAVRVLADFVYHHRALPAKLRPRAYTAATSSGVAAHPDPEQALQRAVLELVERDAFMAAWLGRAPLPSIALRSMPRSVQRRLASLREEGFAVVAKDITAGFAPVVLLYALHAGRGFTCVATHASFERQHALEHALAELEAMLLVKLHADRPAAIAPGEVRRPLDHAALYSGRRWYRRAGHLARPGGLTALSRVGRTAPNGWDGLVQRIAAGGGRIACVDLTPPGASLGPGRPALRVLRALVPGLLPLSFGFGCESLGTPRAAALLGRAKIASLSTGRTSLFPHPFA